MRGVYGIIWHRNIYKYSYMREGWHVTQQLIQLKLQQGGTWPYMAQQLTPVQLHEGWHVVTHDITMYTIKSFNLR